MENSIADKMSVALGATDPAMSLLRIANLLAAEGMSRESIYELFDSYRKRHEHDVERIAI